jgi:hypothetical protein
MNSGKIKHLLIFRKVDFLEGENLAKSFNCQFFEVSAKEETNVQKMLYHSITQLPFFENFKTIRGEDLVGELEFENNDTKLNNESIINSSRNEIQIKNGESSRPKNGNKCKC